MKLRLLAAAAACLVSSPAMAAYSVHYGTDIPFNVSSTNASFDLLFDKPVTGTVFIYAPTYTLFFVDGVRDDIAFNDLIFPIEFENERHKLFGFSGRRAVRPGRLEFDYATGFRVFTLEGVPPDAPFRLRFASSFGVPEPATWALVILGFGAVGGAMRRRVRVAITNEGKAA